MKKGELFYCKREICKWKLITFNLNMFSKQNELYFHDKSNSSLFHPYLSIALKLKSYKLTLQFFGNVECTQIVILLRFCCSLRFVSLLIAPEPFPARFRNSS